MCFLSDDVLLLLAVACEDLSSTLPLVLIVLLPFVVSLVARVPSTSIRVKLKLFEAGTIVLLVLVDGGHSIHDTIALFFVSGLISGLNIELYLVAWL